eukprot:CAMPEP_0171190642 /NCGR_PEP_ID=MMETSP0790-20130122/18958_1 /TAXON_ID=2925 /ORGANISM="Alexandrium catenella, Strain OF101" /LENGTH=89 /DNA_ID=CAMNT_0011655773 /DNA_START=6 /DNA_END=272 /DNA_ORIENTATION=-
MTKHRCHWLTPELQAQAPLQHVNARSGNSATAAASRARLLLLLAVESPQPTAGNFHDLEPHAGNIADCVTSAAKAGNQDLVVLVDEVEA